ncbi:MULTISPECIES: hypothetical protein [Gilliamella]|uniref:Uncharacterized protein n=1 Tax=Gilliamella apicola TaxID=1196095 RepID=A0A556S8X9_9GAMM|nr:MULTISPECIES: hypothetical protein [Gilliamella]MBI0095990.1 hypothetical protein [Gilliamella sp. W8136]TSJ97622.1 hypothetical protein FPQ15_10970 [Gilliamella apicola]
MFNYICKYLLRAANSLKRLVIVMQPPKLKKGKGKNKTAHTPTGIAKARRAAKKMRNKQRSK